MHPTVALIETSRCTRVATSLSSLGMGDNNIRWGDIDWQRVDWEALGRHLDHRVEVELAIPWAQFHERAGISGTYIRRVRRGTTPRLKETTAAKIERAAQWERGSIAATLTGGRPTPTEAAKLTPTQPTQPAEPVGAGSVSSGVGGQSPPPASESEFERFRRWSTFVGETFTPAAFMQLQRDFSSVYRDGYQQARQDYAET